MNLIICIYHSFITAIKKSTSEIKQTKVATELKMCKEREKVQLKMKF